MAPKKNCLIIVRGIPFFSANNQKNKNRKIFNYFFDFKPYKYSKLGIFVTFYEKIHTVYCVLFARIVQKFTERTLEKLKRSFERTPHYSDRPRLKYIREPLNVYIFRTTS